MAGMKDAYDARDQIVGLLSDMDEKLERLASKEAPKPDTHARRRDTQSSVADGANPVMNVHRGRTGYENIIERVILNGAAGAQVGLFIDDPALGAAALITEVTLDARGKFSDGLSNQAWIPQGSDVIAAFGIPAAGVNCVSVLQVKQTRTGKHE